MPAAKYFAAGISFFVSVGAAEVAADRKA